MSKAASLFNENDDKQKEADTYKLYSQIRKRELKKFSEKQVALKPLGKQKSWWKRIARRL